MLFAIRCVVCASPGLALCGKCVDELHPVGPLRAPDGLESLVGLITYEGAGRQLVMALKYRNSRAALPSLANALAAITDISDIDVITWAPTSARRRRRRGFDQSELLARVMGHKLHVPVRRLLRRQSGPAQTGRTSDERSSGVQFDAVGVPPRGVLVVDDVVTTGATLRAAANALKLSGTRFVNGAVLAATP